MTAPSADRTRPALPSPATLLSAAARGAVNHLLQQDEAARARLAVHAGKRIDLTIDALTLRWLIAADGLLAAAPEPEEQAPGAPADLHLSIEADRLRRALAQRAPLARSGARVAGDVELGQTLSWLMEHLRWDAEDDLARWLGDIPARRLVRMGRFALTQLRQQWARAQDDARDWFAQAPRGVVSRAEALSLAAEVATLRDDVARLDKQLAQLRRQLGHS